MRRQKVGTDENARLAESRWAAMPARAMLSPSTWTFTLIGGGGLFAIGTDERLACSCAKSALREAASTRAGNGDDARSGDGLPLGIASVSCC